MNLPLDMTLANYLLKVLNAHDWIDDTNYEMACNEELRERLKRTMQNEQ